MGVGEGAAVQTKLVALGCDLHSLPNTNHVSWCILWPCCSPQSWRYACHGSRRKPGTCVPTRVAHDTTAQYRHEVPAAWYAAQRRISEWVTSIQTRDDSTHSFGSILLGDPEVLRRRELRQGDPPRRGHCTASHDCRERLPPRASTGRSLLNDRE